MRSFSVDASAISKRICTMTLNSSDEKEAFQKLSAGPEVEFTELVPENKNPSWLQEACRSGIQCDVLVVAGHIFGGVFLVKVTARHWIFAILKK